MSKCTDCNEYNKEKHYCPKFCDVIRDTTKEMQEFYKGEHEKLEKIKEIINTAKAYRPTLDSQDIQSICEVLEEE